MQITLTDARTHFLPLKTRMPFRYGIAVLTDLPLCLLVLRFRFGDDGAETTGMASDLLPPKWFKKDPEQPADEELDEMKAVIRQAVTHAGPLAADSPFAFCRALSASQADWAKTRKLPPLLANFGVSLVERALLDAWCRRAGRPLARELSNPALGFDAGQIHAELAGKSPASLLSASPLTSVYARHTLGFGDPLTEGEIAPEDRLDDPLPQSLERAIETYGLSQFKIKIKAEPAEDAERLEAIASVIHQKVKGSYTLSLDGNEMYASWGQFEEFWSKALENPKLRDFLQNVAFIEQPLSRQAAFAETGIGVLPGGAQTPPVIIDESDGEPADLERALDCGYRGVSHKNCKGVFKGVAHRMLLRAREEAHGVPLLMSGEDLANIGPVALLQDLTLQAILGNASVERNGHHYFYGLSMFPEDLQAMLLEKHPELYRATASGVPSLRIVNGKILTAELLNAPFGTHYTPEALESALNLR